MNESMNEELYRRWNRLPRWFRRWRIGVWKKRANKEQSIYEGATIHPGWLRNPRLRRAAFSSADRRDRAMQMVAFYEGPPDIPTAKAF